MNTHYIPRLLLRPFAMGEKINTYDFEKKSFQTKKLRKTFSEENLFDVELEKAFASTLEGPIGDLLNNKLLKGEKIDIDRKENLLLRKFLMINYLRSPMKNTTWDEMLERTQLHNHPSAQCVEFFSSIIPEFRKFFEKAMHSKETYISDLKMAMEVEALEDMANAFDGEVSFSLMTAARYAIVATIAFWDCEGTGQEFILPKLPGISQMDNGGIFHKALVLANLKVKIANNQGNGGLLGEIDRLGCASTVFSDNFSVYPISPTRLLIRFAPYFRAFFPLMNEDSTLELFPPLLDKKQFQKHFFEPMRMELFEPCKNRFNEYYQYEVKKLTEWEVMEINAMLLDMKTEEFAFRDYTKLRDSFWYYDNRAKFALPKKHDFSHMG